MSKVLFLLFLIAGLTASLKIQALVDTNGLAVTTDYDNYIRHSIIDPVVSYWQKTLTLANPNNVGKTITVTSQNQVCDDYMLKTGTWNADMVINFYYISNSSSSTRALSYLCRFAPATQEVDQRPVVTKIWINIATFALPKGNMFAHESNFMTVMHELTHSLGFTTFLKWFDNTTNTLKTPSQRSITEPGGDTWVFYNVSDNINHLIQQYYACYDNAILPGPLMDTISGLHWADRPLFQDYIIWYGGVEEAGVSSLTLAILEGTGFYLADYSMADNVIWGKGRGCPFVSLSNVSVQQQNFPEFRVNTSDLRSCNYYRNAGGKRAYDPLREEGIAYVYPRWDSACWNPNPTAAMTAFSIQSYGTSQPTKCFEGTLGEASPNDTRNTTFCFTYQCSSDKMTLTVLQKDRTFLGTCQQGQSNFGVANYTGYIVCPDVLEFCTKIDSPVCPRNCVDSTRGSCNSGVCSCQTGFGSRDCSLNLNYSGNGVSKLQDNQSRFRPTYILE